MAMRIGGVIAAAEAADCHLASLDRPPSPPASATALASRDRVEALRAIENQSERKVRHDSRNLLERGPSGGDSSNEPSYDSRRESGGGGAPVASQSRESPQAVRAPGSPRRRPIAVPAAPARRFDYAAVQVQGLELPPSVVQHDYNQVAQASQVQQYQQMELPPSLQQQPPGGYSADLEGPVSPSILVATCPTDAAAAGLEWRPLRCHSLIIMEARLVVALLCVPAALLLPN